MAFVLKAPTTVDLTDTAPSVAYGAAVDAGDFLCCTWVDDVFTAAAATITAIADDVNGAWTILDGVNDDAIADPSRHQTGGFAYVRNSLAAAAGALTVTFTFGASGEAVHVTLEAVSGADTAAPIVGHATTGAQAGTFAGGDIALPVVADTAAGDLVIGWYDSYPGDAITAGAGSTLDSASGSGSGGVALLHETANSTVGNNSATVASASGYPYIGGTVIVKQAGGGSGFAGSASVTETVNVAEAATAGQSAFIASIGETVAVSDAVSATAGGPMAGPSGGFFGA